jgi:DNA polymerase-3 subunit epsilon
MIELKKPIIFFDLETTGVDVSKDRIVEMSFIKIFPDGKRETKIKRINPGIPIPKEASDIHGITDEMVSKLPKFKNIRKGLFQWIQGCDFAGYNSNRFDIPILSNEFDRCGGLNPIEGATFIDVFNLFCHFNPRTLEAAYMLYTGNQLENAHSSEADTKATLEIFEGMLNKHDSLKGKDIKDISEVGLKFISLDYAGKIGTNDSGDPIFNFGKYKGHKVENVYYNDINYMEWLINKSELPIQSKKVVRKVLSEKLGKEVFCD